MQAKILRNILEVFKTTAATELRTENASEIVLLDDALLQICILRNWHVIKCDVPYLVM